MFELLLLVFFEFLIVVFWILTKLSLLAFIIGVIGLLEGNVSIGLLLIIGSVSVEWICNSLGAGLASLMDYKPKRVVHHVYKGGKWWYSSEKFYICGFEIKENGSLGLPWQLLSGFLRFFGSSFCGGLVGKTRRKSEFCSLLPRMT